ncbi:hypothetical protein T439DRAFT_64755 [Meredithblackwellia eburnea MCA 4105]
MTSFLIPPISHFLIRPSKSITIPSILHFQFGIVFFFFLLGRLPCHHHRIRRRVPAVWVNPPPSLLPPSSVLNPRLHQKQEHTHTHTNKKKKARMTTSTTY